MSEEGLLGRVQDLFLLLRERDIDYVLVGGIAMLHYIEGRNTEDIDLIMALSSLKALPELTILSQDVNFARANYQGLQIDILLTRNPLFAKVQKYYQEPQRFNEAHIPCATVEGLLLLKLYALPSLYRQGNFSRVGLYENDVATLMYAYRPNMESLFTELAHHLSESDMVAVGEVVADIEQRLERFGKGFAGDQ